MIFCVEDDEAIRGLMIYALDAVGTGADLLPGIVREGVKVVFGLRLTAQQSI